MAPVCASRVCSIHAMRHTLRCIVISLLVLFVWGTQQARAQDYPFFVQPLSVSDLDAVANAVELSPIQRLELLEAHAVYLDELEALQNGRMKRLVDSGIDMMQEVDPMAGKISIPPRRDMESMIREGRAIYNAFGNLDEDFFDRVAPIMSESQALRFELARKVRAVDRYRLVFLQVAGGINGPAGIHLIAGFVADDIRLTPDMVLVLEAHQDRLLNLTMAFEREVFKGVDKVLDKIDEMGLRDMEQQDMMRLFMDEAMIADLASFFNELSEPVQVAASRIAAENTRAWRELQPLIEDPAARFTFDRRVIRTGWRQLRGKVYGMDDRFTKIMDVVGESDPRYEEARMGQERLRSQFDTLLTEYIPLAAKRDKYRTAEFFDGGSHEDIEREESLMDRRDKVVEQAHALLTLLEADLPEDEKVAENKANWAAGGGKEAAFAKMAVEALPTDPLEVEQLNRLLAWVGADEDAMAMVGVLHVDYLTAAEALGASHSTAIETISKDKEVGDWRARRNKQREQRGTTAAEMAALEATLFADLELTIADEAVRKRLADVRACMARARDRAALGRDDWSLRRQPEAMLDLTLLMLEQAPDGLDAAERTKALDAVLAASLRSMDTLESLVDLSERAQMLESRMYGAKAAERDPAVQEQIRASWEDRRDKVGKAAAQLATMNRDGCDTIVEAMGPLAGEGFREAYRRAAFPDLFEDSSVVSEAVMEALSLETLSDDQRRRIEDLRLRHVSSWGDLTDELIRLRADSDIQMNQWPPERESINMAMRNEQLKYRRGQVSARSLAELAVVLDDDQRGKIEALIEAEAARGKTGRGRGRGKG